MKMHEVMDVMENGLRPRGYLVHFEHAGDGFLRSDWFPDVHAGEDPIQEEEDAWQLAQQFATKTRKRRVNVYVIRREDFKPVQGYRERMIENR